MLRVPERSACKAADCHALTIQAPARASCASLLPELLDVPAATALVGAAAETATYVADTATALVAAADATVSLDDLGNDIFIFLAASVLAAWSKRPLGSAPARLLCLLRARLAALDSSALAGGGWPSWRPASASGARASRPHSRRCHCR